MASLSLPRVLQNKKTSLEIEREHFEKFQSQAISKAINAQETPVKEKHVRSTIIGTFHERGAVTYWVVALRLPLQDNRIVAWKFCHVTHKLLREGHAACLQQSQRHIGMMEDLGKLWVHLREGYGQLIQLYCKLLIGKLRFHARNPRVPGNLQLSADQLDAISENDVNNYFQLCVEVFDYMDDLLTLQAAIFESVDHSRSNSMTLAGQCRLAALLPVVQDSSQLYDCGVRLLFRLHAELPPDTLAGHRDRFNQHFTQLCKFYKTTAGMQYFRNLLTVPTMPQKPPNFLIQSDFGTYVPPVVMIPEDPEDIDTVGSLIDTSDNLSQTRTSPDQYELDSRLSSPSPVAEPDPIMERDRLIQQLHMEISRLRNEMTQLMMERNGMLGSMQQHVKKLETELTYAKTELEEERDRIENMTLETPRLQQKLASADEKAKTSDEKFQKMKGAYSQLREEHIALIRQKAEVEKTTATLRASLADIEAAKSALQEKLHEHSREMDTLRQSASKSEDTDSELQITRHQVSRLQEELTQARLLEVEVQKLRSEMETLNSRNKGEVDVVNQKNKDLEIETSKLKAELNTQGVEVSEKNEELNKLISKVDLLEKQEMESRESSSCIAAEKEKELESLRAEVEKLVAEKDAALQKADEVTERAKQEKETFEDKLARSEAQRLTAECELQDLLQHNSSLEEALQRSKEQWQSSQEEMLQQRASFLRHVAASALPQVAAALWDLEHGAGRAPMPAADVVQDALTQLAQIQQAGGSELELMQYTIGAAHNSVLLSSQAALIASNVPDIDVADKLVSESRATLTSTHDCISALASGTGWNDAAGEGARHAAAVMTTASSLQPPMRANVDEELAHMDTVIEEAAKRIEEMLAASRAADSGVKLEVNGKILEACTTLMMAVRALVRDARALQQQLGGTDKTRRPYARNPQWAEGLISAAKAVVVAAKLLVSSADEAMSGAGVLEAVGAASQEVAGSTAQLVAASRARAPPKSPQLAALALASRAVARATAALLATVRSSTAIATEQEDLETTALNLTAARRLEMESKVRALELETALDAERLRLASLRRRHYHLQQEEAQNGNGVVRNGKN